MRSLTYVMACVLRYYGANYAGYFRILDIAFDRDNCARWLRIEPHMPYESVLAGLTLAYAGVTGIREIVVLEPTKTGRPRWQVELDYNA